VSDARGLRASLLTALLTAGMAFSMLLLFVVGALGPFLVHELHLTRSELGALVAAAFGVATLLSLVSGQVVDLVGGRTALVWLLGLVALNLVVLSIAPTAWHVYKEHRAAIHTTIKKRLGQKK